MTSPPTDAIDPATVPMNDGWRVVLAGLAVVLAASLAFPQRRPARRNR